MTDFSWSYSAYSSALSCLRKYKYCYIDKVVPEGPDSGDLIFGSALHSAINASLTGQDGQATFELYWSSYKEKEVEYGRFKWADLSKIGAEFIRKFERFFVPSLKLQFAEKRLHSEFLGVRLDGQPDFIGEFNGVRTLADWKTSSSNYSPNKSDVALQLYLYAYLAIKNGLGPIDQLAYFVFNKGTGSIQTPLVWKFEHDKMLQALNAMTSYARIFQGEVKYLSDAGYPQNWNSCLDYNRKCSYYNFCHLKENK